MKVTVSCTIDYAYECEIDDNTPDIEVAVDAADPVYLPITRIFTQHGIHYYGYTNSVIDENDTVLYDFV